MRSRLVRAYASELLEAFNKSDGTFMVLVQSSAVLSQAELALISHANSQASYTPGH